MVCLLWVSFLVVGLVSYWASEGDYLGRKG